MSKSSQRIPLNHSDFCHDISYNFFGDRLATCGSDKVIKVWGKGEGGKWVLQAELQGHTGSVWKVCWAHPIYGPAILASCSADKTVKIWEERVDPEAKNPWIWKRRAQFLESRESVESIEFAPKHLGLKLATGSSDGWIRIYKTENQLDVAHWQCEHKFLIRPLKNNTSIKSMESSAVSRTGDVGLTCLSWSKSQFDDAMIVIGCASGSPQIWGHNKSFRKWQILSVLEGHTGPVLDVSWAPKLGRSYHLIASASQDKTVRIWKVQIGEGEVKILDQWVLDDHKAEVWSVEWNMTGTMLASTGDDGKAKVWKYAAGGRWICNRDL